MSEISYEYEEIIVTASRLDGVNFDSFEWESFTFDTENVDRDDEDGNGGLSFELTELGKGGLVEVKLSNGLVLLMQFDKLDENSLNAVLFIADHLEQIPELKQLMDAVKKAGYSSIKIFGSDEGYYSPADTNTVKGTWKDLAGRSNLAENVAAAAQPSGDEIIITINTNSNFGSEEQSMKTIVHELLHVADFGRDESLIRRDTDTIIDAIEDHDPFYGFKMEGYSQAEQGIGSSGANNLSGGSGHDYLDGKGGSDIMYGRAGDDLLVGGSGNDIFYGGSGDEELVAGSGTDYMYGATGNDKYVIDSNMSAYISDSSGANDYLEIQITSSVIFDRVGSNLKISNQHDGQTTTVYNWFAGQEIENVAFASGAVFSSQIINQVVAMQNGGGGFLPPIVLDLDGDGLELINFNDSRTRIDLDGDNKKDQTGWVSADDGILVFDQNDNGRVDGVTEFTFTQFGDGTRTDLEGLKLFDDNGDGFITSDDAIWDQLLVWQDDNQNGKSSPKELSSLDELGITSFKLQSDNEIDLIEDNVIFGISEFTFDNGMVGMLGDVALKSDIFEYQWQAESDFYHRIVDHFQGD